MDGAMYSDILAFAALPCILRLVKKIRSQHNIHVVPFPISLVDVVPLPKLTSVPVISSNCLLQQQLPSLPPLSSLLSTRRAVTPSSQSVSYSNTSPLTVLSGSSCYLHSYESSPSSPSISVTTYLDTRNNVPSVGHSNPNVNAAISAQVYAINTSFYISGYCFVIPI